MIRFIIYGLLFFLVIQMIRSTRRIKSNAHQWHEDEGGVPKPPPVHIPDIEDAKFEDLSATDDEEKGKPEEPGPTH